MSKSAYRNPIKIAMDLRYGKTQTSMRDKRDRRKNDAGKRMRQEIRDNG